jgi:hypothetical protein
MDRRNPLTARVVVNHFWQVFFGTGLVRTPEDFGAQGEAPTHPELLDWLAVEFVEHGWDVRHVMRLIAGSATYRQASRASAAAMARDPENRLLARQTRYRLPAWMIRDAALKASGLLSPEIGGPPVRPYQPEGVWEDQSMGRNRYVPTDGPEQYRRTVYAFWRRGSTPAFLFDCAQRRVSEVRSPRTNTPLQALTLLNDLTYVESARVLAERVMRAGASADDGVREVARRVLGRSPGEAEMKVLLDKLRAALAHFRASPADAAKYLRNGQLKPAPGVAPATVASMAVVANLIMNLDEAITRE